MGIRNALRLNRAAGDANAAASIASPWADSDMLEKVVWADIFDRDVLPMTRGVAMKVPAVARARHLIAPTIGRLPLGAFRYEDPLDASPRWMVATKLDVSPYHRMLWTIDDLIFHGWSLWIVERGAANQITDAARLPYSWWDVNAETGQIEIQVGNGQEKRPARADEVILIPGFHEGIVNFGATAIRQAAALSETATNRAENPASLINLHYTGDKPMNRDDIEATVNDWAKARKGDNGGVSFTNKLVEVQELGKGDSQLLVEGRNAAAVEVARIIGIPASMIDAVTASAGLEYNTGETRNGQFIDYGLAAYMECVTARLSADDVVPQKQSVRFDTSAIRDLAPEPTGTPTED